MRTATSRNFLWVGLALPALVAAALLAGTAGVFLVMALGFALALALQDPAAGRAPARGAARGRRAAGDSRRAGRGVRLQRRRLLPPGARRRGRRAERRARRCACCSRATRSKASVRSSSPPPPRSSSTAGWCLLSLTWSHAPGRAFVESDRALLYLLVVVLFGSIARDSRRIAWAVRGVVLGIVVVCTCALITRVLPDVWPIGPNIYENRLAYPITYWNTLGLLAAIGCVLALHLTCSLREAAWMRSWRPPCRSRCWPPRSCSPSRAERSAAGDHRPRRIRPARTPTRAHRGTALHRPRHGDRAGRGV